MSRMRSPGGSPDAQLGFDAMLGDAENSNRLRRFEKETAGLPANMAEALPHYRGLIDRHHAAMMRADKAATMALRDEAHRLALRLNKGEPGIIADDDAPGCVLARETAAPAGTVPLWGQQGEFIVTVGAMRVRIALDGMFGIGSSVGFWPGFSAHAVDWDRPFLSETGYRSFLGIHAEPVPELTPDRFAHMVIERRVAVALRGRCP